MHTYRQRATDTYTHTCVPAHIGMHTHWHTYIHIYTYIHTNIQAGRINDSHPYRQHAQAVVHIKKTHTIHTCIHTDRERET